jgi:hypothetical protein
MKLITVFKTFSALHTSYLKYNILNRQQL